jgi:hypothetical protein
MIIQSLSLASWPEILSQPPSRSTGKCLEPPRTTASQKTGAQNSLETGVLIYGASDEFHDGRDAALYRSPYSYGMRRLCDTSMYRTLRATRLYKTAPAILPRHALRSSPFGDKLGSSAN